MASREAGFLTLSKELTGFAPLGLDQLWTPVLRSTPDH